MMPFMPKAMKGVGAKRTLLRRRGAGVLIGTPGKSRNFKGLRAATQRYLHPEAVILF